MTLYVNLSARTFYKLPADASAQASAKNGPEAAPNETIAAGVTISSNGGEEDTEFPSKLTFTKIEPATEEDKKTEIETEAAEANATYCDDDNNIYYFVFWTIKGLDEICLTPKLALAYGDHAFSLDRLKLLPGESGSDQTVEATAWYCPRLVLNRIPPTRTHVVFGFDVRNNCVIHGLDIFDKYTGDVSHPIAPEPDAYDVAYYQGVPIGRWIAVTNKDAEPNDVGDPIWVPLRESVVDGYNRKSYNLVGAMRRVEGGVSRHCLLGSRIWMPPSASQILVAFYIEAPPEVIIPPDIVKAFSILFGGIPEDGGGTAVPGGPVPPWDPLAYQIMIGLSISKLAAHLSKDDRLEIERVALSALHKAIEAMQKNLDRYTAER